MKKNNIKANYNGAAFFGSIFTSLFTPIKKVDRSKLEKDDPINLRRAY